MHTVQFSLYTVQCTVYTEHDVHGFIGYRLETLISHLYQNVLTSQEWFIRRAGELLGFIEGKNGRIEEKM